MSTFATEEEIRAAHELLLQGKPDFDDDKVKIIQSNESQDVKACPGSGKTTVLLSKLSILSNRLPFEDGSGICVLTHTNVAIDEIKARFGGKADLLFSYPNFCGTIQEFVDKFLTIPCYNSFSQKPLLTIDDDRAIHHIRKAFFSKNWDEQRIVHHLLKEDPDYKRAFSKKDWNTVRKMRSDLVEGIYVQLTPEKFYRKYSSRISIASKSPKKQTPTYEFMDDVRLAAFREGILKYEDAFSVALSYLSIHPGIRESLSTRFKYVFIDETQDTSDLQLKVLDGVFDPNLSVIQRFGDDCQSIYNNDEKECAWRPREPLPLNNSLRFGEPIAKVLQSICIEDNRFLHGNSEVHSVKPVILVYDDPETVLPAFAQLLRESRVDGRTVADIALSERHLDPLHRVNVKAIGFVGKAKQSDGEYHSIHRYFPQFDNQTTSKRPFGDNVTLGTFIQKDMVYVDPQKYRKQILDALVVTLERADVRRDDGYRYTPTSMMAYLENANPLIFNLLNLKISEWVIKIVNSDSVLDDSVFESVKGFILQEFAQTFGFDISIESLEQFLRKDVSSQEGNKIIRGSQNVFCDGELEIEVNTVHSAKGETHAATLFLETKYYKYESEHFGSQICGEPYKRRKGDSHVATALRVAYVAMSRPRYLLAFAVHKSRFEQLDRKKIDLLWEVKMIDI